MEINKEKCYLISGIESRKFEGNVYIVTGELCGLKYDGASFRTYMASKLYETRFKQTHDDPDLWIQPEINTNGE